MPVLQFKGKTGIETYHPHGPTPHIGVRRQTFGAWESEKTGFNGNLIIEGDNRIALKALLAAHAGRIKCICIDPPYYTGHSCTSGCRLDDDDLRWISAAILDLLCSTI